MAKKPKTAPPPDVADPLWYKDATIYQLHVKSFADSNGDGIGDLAGLIGRLDYIAELGVDAIWLLPFYPSPRRDDGYDISDYRSVHPDYGTMADFRRLVASVHARGMRVITELVINHTSDRHPWFERARRAKPGSAARDYYVWSDTDQRHADTRIIFIDTEKSNWTWDPVAGAYFWHRFYSHQPDLNFDNPKVLEEVLSVMRFWLDLGIDGLRLDAVPYLIERDGTNNENLPETHAILKRIRAEMDAHAPGRMLLAEANQWPEDAQLYFGDGDECNMAFHFPLMPRMYMAIAQEDRFPISDILRQTPAIPANCQWAVFLRNHDELTLEMVTDSERDVLWTTYAADQRARLNLGIRRRLAPLLEHDRRRIELMNGLLLSMPGTPVIYYGDEIGMGDNIHLGDRDGVRTPMHWSPDRNGGFSRANPQLLVLPPIMDAVYGFAAVNVEAQLGDAHSLLNWTRRMLAVRKGHQAFGRGTLRFLYPDNRKVLAFLREHENDTLLCVSNLSRNAQAVELDLSDFAGRIPVDLLGNSAFPAVGSLNYLLTLPPYAFYWFVLAAESELPTWHVRAPEPMPELTTLVLRHGLAEAVDGAARATLELEVLPCYLARRRWFASKDRRIAEVRLLPDAILSDGGTDVVLAEIVVTAGDRQETYQLPLTITWEDAGGGPLVQQLALARVRRVRRVGFLTDAFAVDALPRAVVRLLRDSAVLTQPDGELRFLPGAGLAALDLPDDAPIRRLSAEQSNSSLIVGDAIMLKLLRRITPGLHPELEMSRHLTENGYQNTPPLLGHVQRQRGGGEACALMIVQGFIRNQGDGWDHSQDVLARLTDSVAVTSGSGEDATDQFAGYLNFAAAVGRRLAELHAVLARPSAAPAFAPKAASAADTKRLAEEVKTQLDAALAAIDGVQDWPDPTAATDARRLRGQAKALRRAIDLLCAGVAGALQTRIHGDFHLGQVLVVQGDAYLIDFEGEPARPLDERRAKASPLRDVAGMVRSLDYARAVAMPSRASLTPQVAERRAALLDRFHNESVAAFLGAYRVAHAEAEYKWATPAMEPALLDLFLLQKAAYEVCYEAANRLSWLPVPLRGLAELADRMTHE